MEDGFEDRTQTDFVSAALACGKSNAKPHQTIINEGLGKILESVDKLKGAISCAKIIVHLDPWDEGASEPTQAATMYCTKLALVFPP